MIHFVVNLARVREHWKLKFGTDAVAKASIMQAESLRTQMEQNWRDKESIILSSLKRITGLDTAGSFTAYVMPAELEIGHYLDEKNIEWGYPNLYENYSLIGIAHELIHCLTHHFYTSLSDDDKWLFHSIIYLSADEEIRFILNGKDDYFSSPIIATYHERLLATAKRILPYWKEHIASPSGKDIYTLFRDLQEKNV